MTRQPRKARDTIIIEFLDSSLSAISIGLSLGISFTPVFPHLTAAVGYNRFDSVCFVLLENCIVFFKSIYGFPYLSVETLVLY